MRLHIRKLLANLVAGSYIVPPKLRAPLLRLAAIKIGQGTLIHSGCLFAGDLNITIGPRGFIAHHCMFDSAAPIAIGSGVYFGPHVNIVTSSHEVGGPERRAGLWTNEAVSIGNGTWLGASVTVLPGVTIGAGCVVAAGAVVPHDLSSHGLYAGVPARHVRTLGP